MHSPDGKLIAASSEEIWNARDLSVVHVLTGHRDSVSDVAWSTDETQLLSSSDDFTLRIWNASTGETVSTLTGHTSSVCGCAWSPDSKRVASVSRDKSLRIWDPKPENREEDPQGTL